MNALNARSIAVELEAEHLGADLLVEAPASLSDAEPGTLVFVGDTEKYAAAFETALANGAVVLAPLETRLPSNVSGALILVQNPRSAFGQLVARHFAPRTRPGIAETARVHPSATVHETAYVGEYTVVREGASIGAHSEIRDHVVIGHNVVIGEHALIKSHAVIGEEGFGMEHDAEGNYFRIPHLGSVRIGDHVEVGGFTTVCAGTLKPTVVGDYTKIDDHVHIAHNCQIGRNVAVIACAEVSGSVVLEDDTWVGPNASIIQGLTLGKGSLLGIGAVTLKSMPEGEVWVGNPAKPLPRKSPQ